MVAPRPEKAYEKYAWVFILAPGVVLALGSVQYLLGMTADSTETMVSLRIDLGVALLWGSTVTVALAAVPFRRGESWSWYSLLITPVILIGYLAIDIWNGGFGPLGPMFVILLLISLIGLVMPYKKFFPRKQA